MSLEESILTSENSPLKERVFGDTLNKEGKNIDQDFFKEWLHLNGYIAPNFVSREEFEAFQGDFLKKETNDSQPTNRLGKYTLTLPIDMTRGELIQIIDTFRTILDLDDTIDGVKQTPYPQLLAEQILYLRMAGISKKELERELIEKYHISTDLIKRIRAVTLSADRIKEIRQIIAEKSGHIIKENIKISGQEIKKNQQYQAEIVAALAKKLSQVLDTAVFHSGRDLLRHGLYFITAAWEEARKNELRESGHFTEIVSPEGVVFEEKNPKTSIPQEILFRSSKSTLQKEEMRFRQVIRVDEYHEKLKIARNKKNIRNVIKLEKKFTKTLLKKLHKFPYQHTHSPNSYTPHGVVDTRELQCLGFSLVAHAYLSELGITHHALSMPQHSALSVTIGGIEYYFDATAYVKLYLMEWNQDNENREGVEFSLINFFNFPIYSNNARRGDPEMILQSQILMHCGLLHHEKKQFPEAIAYYSRVINLDSQHIFALKTRASAYVSSGEFEDASGLRALGLDPKDGVSYETYGIIIQRGKNFDKKSKQGKLALYIAETISMGDFFHGMGEVLETYYKIEKDHIDMILGSNRPDRFEILQDWFFQMYDESEEFATL